MVSPSKEAEFYSATQTDVYIFYDGVEHMLNLGHAQLHLRYAMRIQYSFQWE